MGVDTGLLEGLDDLVEFVGFGITNIHPQITQITRIALIVKIASI